jgi:hypothetical protein
VSFKPFVIAFAGCILAVFLSACDGADDPDVTPSATPALPEAPTATPLPAATPPPATDPGVRRAPLTIWLIDATDGSRATLVEDYDFAGWLAGFSSRGDAVIAADLRAEKQAAVRFNLEGIEVGRGAPQSFCQAGGLYEPNSYEAMVCLPPETSPDGRWMLSHIYDQPPGTTSNPPPKSALWAENQQTGERILLQDGLQHCGGCDARFGPRWSRSGRYVVYAETGGAGRAFLSDLVSRSTRQIGNGNEIGDAPHWSPAGDVLLRRSASDGVIIDDLAAGTSRELDLSWPANFDATGDYVFSPSYTNRRPNAEKDNAPGQMAETIVQSLATGNVIARLSGSTSFLHLWREMEPIAQTDGALLTALEFAEGCQGTVVYLASDRVDCVENTTGAAVAPDGSKIALARVTGATGRVDFPGGGSVSLPIYEVVLFDVEQRSETVVATDAISDQPPAFLWNDASTHLLVRWPAHSGL